MFPVIASGGLGSQLDVKQVVEQGKADAVAVGKAFHFDLLSIDSVKQTVQECL